MKHESFSIILLQKKNKMKTLNFMKVDQTSYVPHLVEGRSSFVETDVSLPLL